jgi:hypothetical protein
MTKEEAKIIDQAIETLASNGIEPTVENVQNYMLELYNAGAKLLREREKMEIARRKMFWKLSTVLLDK